MFNPFRYNVPNLMCFVWLIVSYYFEICLEIRYRLNPALKCFLSNCASSDKLPCTFMSFHLLKHYYWLFVSSVVVLVEIRKKGELCLIEMAEIFTWHKQHGVRPRLTFAKGLTYCFFRLNFNRSNFRRVWKSAIGLCTMLLILSWNDIFAGVCVI